MNARSRLRLLPVVVALAPLLVGCDEEVVVEQDTVVYRDDSVYRRLELHGRGADGEIPAEPGWLATDARVVLAEPEAWRLLEERPDGLIVEAVFDGAGSVPASLAHETDEGTVPDRSRVRLDVQDLSVLTRRVYEETLGDPFGPSSLDAALDALTTLAVESLREELRLEFGGRVSAAPAEVFLRDQARRLAGELMGILREHPWGADDVTERTRLLSAALARQGIPAPGDLGEAADWGDALGMLLDPVLLWSRDRIASSVSTTDEPVSGEDLGFWPTAEDLGAILGTETDEPEPPRVAEFKRSANSLLRAVEGLYGDPGSTRFRFEAWLELPGRLLHTNGTPGEGGVLWVFDNRALAVGVTLRAESVETNDDALVALGARRDLGDAELLRLVALLTDPERGERLREVMARALDERSFDPLGDEDMDGDLQLAALELLELLDPSIGRWP